MAKKARNRDRASDAHRRKVHADYVRRHPERAREERALRQAHAAATRDFGHKRAGTPETHAKAASVLQGALARLARAGAIDADQLAWAGEIRHVHDRLGADVSIGTVSLETRVDQSRHADGTFFERLGAVRAEVAYTAWRAGLARPGPVLAMIAGDEACRAVEQRYHLRNGSAKLLLIAALDDWPSRYADARRDVDEEDLLRAHARLN